MSEVLAVLATLVAIIAPLAGARWLLERQARAEAARLAGRARMPPDGRR